MLLVASTSRPIPSLAGRVRRRNTTRNNHARNSPMPNQMTPPTIASTTSPLADSPAIAPSPVSTHTQMGTPRLLPLSLSMTRDLTTKLEALVGSPAQPRGRRSTLPRRASPREGPMHASLRRGPRTTRVEVRDRASRGVIRRYMGHTPRDLRFFRVFRQAAGLGVLVTGLKRQHVGVRPAPRPAKNPRRPTGTRRHRPASASPRRTNRDDPTPPPHAPRRGARSGRARR